MVLFKVQNYRYKTELTIFQFVNLSVIKLFYLHFSTKFKLVKIIR